MFTTRRRSWGDIPSLFGPDGEELERPWEQFLDTSGAQLVGQTKEGKDIFEKEIKGLPGMKLDFPGYFVRSDGTLRMRNNLENGEPRIVDGCYDKDKYKQVSFSKDRKTHTTFVHRLVAAAFVRNSSPDIFDEVDHINHKRDDNRAENLRWLSRSLNALSTKSDRVTYDKRCRKPYKTNVPGVENKRFKLKKDAIEHAKKLNDAKFLRLYKEAIYTSPASREAARIEEELDGHAIDLREHADKPLFTAAKNAVFGVGKFVHGQPYIELQGIVNKTVRGDPDCLRWAHDAPKEVRRLNFRSPTSFSKAFSRFLRLSRVGLVKLQRALNKFFYEPQHN